MVGSAKQKNKKHFQNGEHFQKKKRQSSLVSSSYFGSCIRSMFRLAFCITQGKKTCFKKYLVTPMCSIPLFVCVFANFWFLPAKKKNIF
jgi:hypothetical protein